MAKTSACPRLVWDYSYGFYSKNPMPQVGWLRRPRPACGALLNFFN